jgi:hypothetical protein
MLAWTRFGHRAVAMLAIPLFAAACGTSEGTSSSAGGSGGGGAVSADVSGVAPRGGSTDAGSDTSAPNPDAAVAGKVIPESLGVSCAGTGTCPDGLDCYGNIETPSAICTWVCSGDVDCPAAYQCIGEKAGGDKICLPRKFCSSCDKDEQCGPGGRCVDMGNGSAKFCSRECSKNTGCPRYADCVDNGDGTSVCKHNSGTCEGDGSLCAPCIEGGNGCQEGGVCLTYLHTKESFCSAGCTSSCPSGYSCTDVGSPTGKQCIPADKSAPKCVPKIHATMEVGDIMDDFEMVGYMDTDGDGSVLKLADGSNEQPMRLKLSEYAGLGGFKLILFNVSAGWCGPCQQETLGFKPLMKAYPDVGIFQVIFDGATQGSKPSLTMLKQWITKLNGVGAVGVDQERNVIPINTAGSTPLNIIIDAQSRKILKKFNGAPAGSLGSVLAPYLK